MPFNISHNTNVSNYISNITTHNCAKWQPIGKNGIPEAELIAGSPLVTVKSETGD